MTRSTRLLWVVHLVANVVFALLAWLWLGIPDARTWQLGFTAILGLIILGGMLWLHGSTFRYFSEADPVLAEAFRAGLKRLPLFALWAVAFVMLEVLVARWQPSGSAFGVVRWLLLWIGVPAFLLPAAVAAMGNRDQAIAAYRSVKYWLITAALLVIGVYLPFRLILWAPQFKSFTPEMLSFAARWLGAYLGVVTAWLTLAYVSSGGTPRFSQPNTASLP